MAVTQLRYPRRGHTNRFAMPAGGLFSTATDLGRFCQMLLIGGTLEGRRYVSSKAIKEMARNQLSGEAQKEVPPDMRIDPQRGLATVRLVQHAGIIGWNFRLVTPI